MYGKILFISVVLLSFSIVYGYTQSAEVVILDFPKISTECNGFVDNRIGEVFKYYDCEFNFSARWLIGAADGCSFIVKDETKNTIIDSKNLRNISQVSNLSYEDGIYYSIYDVSYEFMLYFKEDGKHRVTANLLCENQENSIISLWDLQILSTNAYEEYKLQQKQIDILERQADEQRENNARSYTISIILAIGTIVAPIIVAWITTRDKRRIVIVEKMPG